MSNVERKSMTKMVGLKILMMWYVNNCGAKWVSVDEWDYIDYKVTVLGHIQFN